jgi:hypothetical protein
MTITTNTLTAATAELETFDRLLKELEKESQASGIHSRVWRNHEPTHPAIRQNIRAGILSASDAIAELEGKLNAAFWAEREKRDRAYVKSHIPEEYQQPIVRSRLPNRRAFDELQGWFRRAAHSDDYSDDKRGIIAVGATGQAKTRSLAQFLITGFTTNVWSVDDGHSFLFLPATQLKRSATISAGKPGVEKWERTEAEKLIASARTCEVLLLDDLSQPKFTPAYAETLYEIVEYRTSHRLLNLVSLQLGRDEFLAKVSDGNPHLLTTADAIFRRLADYCDTIDFDDADGSYDPARWLAQWTSREV